MKRYILTLTVIIVSAFSLSFYLHLYRRSSDYNFESNLRTQLIEKQTYAVGAEFEKSDIICFLQSYAQPDAINIKLSNSSKKYLNLIVNGNVGTDDSVWWIFGFKDGELSNVYRMSGKVRPAKNSDICKISKNLILKYLNIDFGIVTIPLS